MRSTFRLVRRALPYVAALAAIAAVARRPAAATDPAPVPSAAPPTPPPAPTTQRRSRLRRRWPLVLVAVLAAFAAAVGLVVWPSGTNASVDWNSGFEQTWAPWQGLQYTGPLASSFQYVTNPVRTGSYSAMFRTEQGYGAYSGEGPNLCCGPTGEGAPGSDHYWALSAYWPTDWVEAYHWGIFFQFHQGNDTSPPIAFEANADDVTVDIRTGKTNPSTGDWAYTNYPKIINTLSKGQWNDFVIHVRWSVTDGQIEVWHRLPGNAFSEVLNLDHIPTLQQNANDGSIAGVYTLLGFYRDSYCGTTSVTPGCSPNKVQPTQTYYADNFVRGSSFDEVVNAAWGSGGAVPTPPTTTSAPVSTPPPSGSSPQSSSSSPSTAATTFGNTSGGSAVDSGGADYLDASGPYTVSAASTMTKLTGQIAGEASPMKVRGVVYADANGKPGPAVATTNEVTIAAGSPSAWVDLPFASPVSLPAGSYWLGYWYGAGAGSGGGGFHFTTDGGSEIYAPSSYQSTGSAPSSFPSASSASSRYALYATLAAASAPAVDPPATPSATPAATPSAPTPSATKKAPARARPKAKAAVKVTAKPRRHAAAPAKKHAVHPKQHKAARPVCQASVTTPPVEARTRMQPF